MFFNIQTDKLMRSLNSPFLDATDSIDCSGPQNFYPGSIAS